MPDSPRPRKLDPKNYPDYHGLTSEQVQKIKITEGFSEGLYKDGKAGSSIGYGHNLAANPGVLQAFGFTILITKEQADVLLRYNIYETVRLYNHFLGKGWDKSLSRGQRFALIFHAYNVGTPSAAKLVKPLLEKGDYAAIAEALRNHKSTGHQGDKKVDLSDRREYEARYFDPPLVSASGGLRASITWDRVRGFSWALGGSVGITLTGPAAVAAGVVLTGWVAYKILYDQNDIRTHNKVENEEEVNEGRLKKEDTEDYEMEEDGAGNDRVREKVEREEGVKKGVVKEGMVNKEQLEKKSTEEELKGEAIKIRQVEVSAEEGGIGEIRVREKEE